MLTDAELLRRYDADRSETAFAELVRRHLDGVYSSALRRVGFDTHLAQDVAQAVFIALARQSRALADHPFLTAWLYAATRNEAATTVRRERRRKTREAVASAMNETNASSSAEDAADWSRLSPVLDDSIDDLSEKDRAAILLRFIDRRPFAEIGAQLKVTEDAARMRVDRALEKLRALLAKRGLTSTSAAIGLLLANNAVAATPTAVATSVTLAAIGTIPATATAAAIASAKISTSAALSLSAKTYLAITGLAAASLGYFVFARPTALTPPIAPSSATVPVASQTPQRVWSSEEAAARAFLESHPEVKKALHAYYHARFKTTHAHIYRALALNKTEVDELQTLLTEGNTFSSSFFPDLKLPAGDGLTPAEATARIESLLGPERYLRWKALQRDYFPRRYTEDIARGLAFTDAALDSYKTGLLLDLINAHRRAEDWDAVITEAQKFLSPPQTQAFNRAYVSILIDFPDHLFPDHVRPKTLPDPQTVQLERQRGRIISEYAPFYEIAHLSASTRAAFEQILLDEQDAINRKDRTLGSERATASRQVRLLGEDGYRELKNFRRTQFVYTLISDFAAHAAISGHALTRQQCEQLVPILISCAGARSSWVDPATIDWNKVDKLSKKILKPVQQEIFQTTEQRPGVSRPQFQLESALRAALNVDVYNPPQLPSSLKVR